MNYLKLLEKEIKKNNFKPIINIALSAGPDSAFLLYFLHNLLHKSSIHLNCIHFNHGLHKDSNSWEATAIHICELFNVPLETFKLDLDVNDNNLEANARKARYDVLNKRKNEIVALGHHVDDLIETFFIQTLRGSGVNGLSCFKDFQIRHNVLFIRPLLSLKKSKVDIINMLQSKDIPFVLDPSNMDEKYNRNFIRHKIIPSLYQYYGIEHVQNNLIKVVDNMQSTMNFVATSTDRILQNVSIEVNGDYILLVDKLYHYNTNEICHVIREFIKLKNIQAPFKTELDEILKQLVYRNHKNISPKAYTTYTIPSKQITMFRHGNNLGII